MKLIASDLDGTLLHRDCTVSDYTKNILRRLIREKGCLFLPTTGRCYRSAEKTIGDIEEIRYFNTSNGCLLYDRKEDKILINHVIPEELAYEIFIDVQKLGGAMEIYSGLDSYLDKEKFPLALKAFNKELSDNLYSTTIPRSLKSIKKGIRSGRMQVNKYNAVFRSEKDKQRVFDKYKDRDDVIVTVPTPYNLEIFYAGCDKDAGIRLLQEKEGIAHEDTIAIGDSLNDMVMVKYAKLGLAVANSMEPLKEAADQIVGSNMDDGPAHFLEDTFLKEEVKAAKEVAATSAEEVKAAKEASEIPAEEVKVAKEAAEAPAEKVKAAKEATVTSAEVKDSAEVNSSSEEIHTDKKENKSKKKDKTPVADAAKKAGNKKGMGRLIKSLAILLAIIVLVAAAAIYLFTMDGSPLFGTMIQDEIDDFQDSQSKMDADYVGTGRIPVDVIDESGDFFNVYYMDTLSKTAPIVISIHGGGLVTGNKEYNHYACEELCSRGCLVYAIDYQLVPEVYMQDELQEISQKIDRIMEDARDRGFQSEQVCLLGDEAGGLLALYTTACQYDETVAEAFDVEPAATPIASVGTFSGLFYTTGMDRVGVFMSNHYYGNFYQGKKFSKYLDPDYLAENVSLPPMYLVSSTGDSLKSDTTKFAKALTDAGQSVETNVVEDDRLEYDFPITHPYADASQEVFDEICEFYKGR